MSGTEGFERFVREHQDMVYTTALRLLGRESEAEDAAQDVFLKAFERFTEVSAMENPGGWLRTVTTNLCLNHLGRHRRRWSLFSELEDEAFEESLPAPSEPSLAEELERALLALPDHQRVPLVLFHFSELGYSDIALKLGASLGKVKTDIFRGRAALRRILGEDCDE
jgi:RNA polymerase sigma-70 factor (ECF subfamily)